jgi:hypothetical protein
MMNLTENQNKALKSLVAGPGFLHVGTFTPLRDKGLVEKCTAPSPGGRGQVFCKLTDAGRVA